MILKEVLSLDGNDFIFITGKLWMIGIKCIIKIISLYCNRTSTQQTETSSEAGKFINGALNMPHILSI